MQNDQVPFPFGPRPGLESGFGHELDGPVLVRLVAFVEADVDLEIDDRLQLDLELQQPLLEVEIVETGVNEHVLDIKRPAGLESGVAAELARQGGILAGERGGKEGRRVDVRMVHMGIR